ncbi:retropepsin-like aspartic protease family protein [Agarilytica rhodophyticola]|uniref:retropepsin-like aspartic protease family protein n=1 Tax=Agarilytica rhodophyticola TaxID=1737490 RepID=UPI000B34535C|nr:retropepsin-like aspartic protease [Agarilytica rhodophyticola]
MMSRLTVIFALCIGFVLGWYGHGVLAPPLNSQQALNIPTFIDNKVDTVTPFHSLAEKKIVVLEADGHEKNNSLTGDAENPIPTQSTTDISQVFVKYLDNRNYFDAIQFFQEVNDSDRIAGNALKKILLTRLSLLLEQNLAEDFTELANAYLTTYYEDLDVLLMLAEFNRQTEYYIEAIGVFQLAKEYAYSIKDNEKVIKEFTEFLSKVDKFLSESLNWYTLSQVYLQADIVGLLSPQQKFRQAQVVLENGDLYHAKQILSDLSNDSRVAADVKQLLAKINDTPSDGLADTSDRSSRFSSAVALNPRGNQYLIDISLGDNTSSTLLIDTGASMTTLSRSAFENISHAIDYSHAGSRMFSTANGLTKGSVYRVDTFTIGDFEIADTLVAVLDFEMGGGVHGLLGMNILGNFKFQIEQDSHQLLLEPRQN